MKWINIQIILEYTWLVLFVVMLVIGITTSIRVGFGEGFSSFILAVLCFLLYLLRRNKRIHESRKQTF